MKRECSPLDDLADLLHSDNSVDRWMAMLRAYCDESGNHEGATVFMTAGLLGKKRDWKSLERRWKRALAKEGISVFHAADLEGGYGEFAHLFGPQHRSERDRIQRRFIDIILESNVFPVSSGIVMSEYHDLLPRLRLIRKSEKYTKSPYFLSFEDLVMQIARHAGFFSDLERVAFIFDRQRQFSGRAKELYDEIVALRQVSYFHRLGPLTFDDKAVQIALQAADLFAYESYRYLGEHKIAQDRR